jgi:hypothetical protein
MPWSMEVDLVVGGDVVGIGEPAVVLRRHRASGREPVRELPDDAVGEGVGHGEDVRGVAGLGRGDEVGGDEDVLSQQIGERGAGGGAVERRHGGADVGLVVERPPGGGVEIGQIGDGSRCRAAST